TSDIKFKSILVEKKQCIDDLDLINKLSKQLSGFLRDHMETFIQYDRIVCYYDYGQRELTHILVSVFSAMFNNAEFKKVMPANYKLSQAADLLCTMELLSIKSSKQLLSKSEFAFFKSVRDLNKSYLRALNSKKL
ncbi:MAG: hypothetical protein FWD05_10395, partial [Oscillospiraceae bacterium]|nr:hypothetical protein [Oscillospiraceae bacterium]